MMSKRLRPAAAAALLLGLAACSEKSGTPTSPTSPTPSNEVSFAAVGASDGIGYGGTSPCLPFADCPDGSGYVQSTIRRLRAQGRTVTVTNLSIPGAVLSREIEDLGNSLGRGITTVLCGQIRSDDDQLRPGDARRRVRGLADLPAGPGAMGAAE